MGLSDSWIKSAVLRNRAKDLAKNLAFEFRKAETVEDTHGLITIYLHDPVIGLARGQPGPLICLIAKDQAEEETEQPKVEPPYVQPGGLPYRATSSQARAEPRSRPKRCKRNQNGQRKGQRLW